MDPAAAVASQQLVSGAILVEMSAAGTQPKVAGAPGQVRTWELTGHKGSSVGPASPVHVPRNGPTGGSFNHWRWADSGLSIRVARF